MKKFILLFCVCSLAMLAGCTRNTEARDGNTSSQIAPLALSDEQQEIVGLIARNDLEILLFDYTLNEPFTGLEVWVEIYHYGVLQEHSVGLNVHGDRERPLDDGRISIVINQIRNKEFQWSISIGGAGSISEPWVADSGWLGRGFGSIQEAITIESGHEIILYSSKFSNSSAMQVGGDIQRYLETPEILNEYTYVHLIKARFI